MRVKRNLPASAAAVVAAVAVAVTLGWLSAHTNHATLETREVLCIGIMSNTANTSRFDPRLVELCGEVGVSPIGEAP